MITAKLVIWVSVILSGLGQVFLKKGMMRVRHKQARPVPGIARLVRGVVGEFYVWLWGVTFVAATVLWLFGLRRVDLSYAYPLVSFGYVLVTVLAALLFGEKISRTRWIAIAVICMGVVLIAGS